FSISFSQQNEIDTSAIRKIWNEGTERSQVMSILGYLTDVCGPRLTGSPQYTKAAQWAMKSMSSWGVANTHLEGWGPFGKSWSLERYSALVTEPDIFPLISFPKAWSPGTKGDVSGEAILFDPKTDSALATFKGKLKGKFILLDDPRAVKPGFEPRASHETDSTLMEQANSDVPKPRRSRFGIAASPDAKKAAMFAYNKTKMIYDEGALAILTASRGDGGNIFVQQAGVLVHPDTPRARRPQAWEVKSPKILPQIAVGAEHYNRLYRLLQRGEKVRMNMELETKFYKADSAYNVIGEIPGTDLADEVVMIGAHLDSWHGGTGATDNATGSAVCLEAMRILKAAGLTPRRTIRIGLWSGEEQGLFGSEAYVAKHFGTRAEDSTKTLTLKPESEKFSVYFNDDNGTGRVRGVYMQGNESVRPIFRKWLTAIGDPTAETLTLQNTGSTDHVPFDQIGLPAFQFIQDEIEYSSMTHHSTMDVYDRVIEKDVQQSAVIMAIFAYSAAMRDEKLPRKK
ncbi:MAG: M20/M25/M40 family metallo-hydrolase, partial [bacterium]